MENKKNPNDISTDDLRGFEEFIEGEKDTSFLYRNIKKDKPVEHATFINYDSSRLEKIRDLCAEKIPLAKKYEQGQKLLEIQEYETQLLKNKLIEILNKPDSSYRKSLREIFDSFYQPPKN
jgi:hypothetical protein